MTEHEILQNNGFKVTKQRIAILRCLLMNRSGGLSVEEIFEKAVKIETCLSVATVYRFVNDIEQSGLVQKTVVEPYKTHKYELHNTAQRFLLVCNHCGTVLDVRGNMIKKCSHLARTYGFKVANYSLVIYGNCRSCSPGSSTHSSEHTEMCQSVPPCIPSEVMAI